MSETPKALSKPAKQEISASEQARTKAAAAAFVAKTAPFRVEVRTGEKTNQMVIEPAYGEDHDLVLGQLATFGTASPEFANELIGRLAAVARHRDAAMPTSAELNSALAAVQAVEPENEIEAMLATQMYATHEIAMEMLSRTKQTNSHVAMQNCSTIAVKLLRTYTAQIEALAKLRRGGEQTVRVEHVHVHEGGQAIVGNVAHQGAGTGGFRKKGPTTP